MTIRLIVRKRLEIQPMELNEHRIQPISYLAYIRNILAVTLS
jgi:hypothetical protein